MDKKQNKPKENTLHPVHDRFFKAAIAHVQVAKQLFEQYLPVHIRESIDFNSLALWQGEMTNNSLDQSAVDVVYQAQMKSGESCYCYAHAEQQREPERHLPLRLLSYKCALLTQHAQQYPREPLPPVFSIVIYNGERAYPYPTDLLALFADSSLAKETLLNPVQFIDLSKTADHELSQHAWSGSMLGLLKHIRRADLPTYIQGQLRTLLGQIEKEVTIS